MIKSETADVQVLKNVTHGKCHINAHNTNFKDTTQPTLQTFMPGYYSSKLINFCVSLFISSYLIIKIMMLHLKSKSKDDFFVNS